MDGKLAVFVVPADRQLDLHAAGKRAVLAERAEAERATGYVVGGISPLGQRKRLPATIDETALAWETVLVSAGRRGLQIELAPADLVALTGARVAPIARSRLLGSPQKLAAITSRSPRGRSPRATSTPRR